MSGSCLSFHGVLILERNYRVDAGKIHCLARFYGCSNACCSMSITCQQNVEVYTTYGDRAVASSAYHQMANVKISVF